jgi:hypothetical protein
MYLMGQYRGVDTINARLAPGEVVLNPGQIDAIGRGRIMGTLARTGGKFVNATGYASGGLVGANEILGTASAYLTSPGGTARAASAAASHYTRIPQLISRDTKDRHRLVKAVAGEQHLLDSLRKSLHGLTGAKNAGKRKGIQDRISGIVSLMRHHKHDISAKTRQINALEGELGIVPGEDRFQRLVDDLEGQQVAATTFGNTALAGRLQKAEVTDYQRRVRFLSNFTQLKGVRKIPDLWQAANQALVARSGELSSLTGATTGGGGGAGGGGPDQHTQDVMDSLRDFVAQAIQMQAVTAGQTSLAMDFLRSQVGSFAAGTDYVPRTGYAMVHQGEAVIPAWQNGPRADSMTGNFTINGSDALTQAIARAITPSVQIEMGRMTRRLTRERRR